MHSTKEEVAPIVLTKSRTEDLVITQFTGHVVKLLRLSHWLKNLLVLAPLFFSQDFTVSNTFYSLLAFVCFCFISSAIYIINDSVDASKDRQHPEKRFRPIASGAISIPTALIICATLLGTSVLLTLLLPWQAQIIFAVYFILNINYSFFLKKLLIIDVMVIALGFVLRVLAGGLAASLIISPWIILCTFFISLFLGFGKRKNEVMTLQDNSRHHRKVLEYYTPDFLNQLLSLTAAMSIIGYALYTIDANTIKHFGSDKLIYTLPFVVYGIFRYYHIIYNKSSGGEPTKIFLSDVPIRVTFLAWLFTIVIIRFYF